MTLEPFPVRCIRYITYTGTEAHHIQYKDYTILFYNLITGMNKHISENKVSYCFGLYFNSLVVANLITLSLMENIERRGLTSATLPADKNDKISQSG